MATFEIAAAPFPYIERPIRRRRPCLIIGRPPGPTGLVWVLMITSAQNAPWDGDIEIKNLDQTGLRASSVVRTAKIATVEEASLKKIGILPTQESNAVSLCLRDYHEAAKNKD